MTSVFAYGRLGSDPREHTTKHGATMATASLAADVGGASSDGRAETVWFGVVAFGSAADNLLRCRKGELLGVAGRLQLSRWTDDAGEERERLQVAAGTVVSARTARPKGGRAKQATSPDAPTTSPLDSEGGLGVSEDDLPF